MTVLVQLVARHNHTSSAHLLRSITFSIITITVFVTIATEGEVPHAHARRLEQGCEAPWQNPGSRGYETKIQIPGRIE